MNVHLNHLSLGMILDDVVSNKEDEKTIIENIRYCRKHIGKLFKVIFINKNLPESNVKEFFKRNEKVLFELNTKITKHENVVWFMISSYDDKIKYRYKYKGSILKGIVEYKKMVDILIKKEKDESSYTR